MQLRRTKGRSRCELEDPIIDSGSRLTEIVRLFQEVRKEREKGRNHHSATMIMDVVEANGVRSQARWGAPLAVSAEALIVLVVTAVFVQLKYSFVLPRILLILSRCFSFLLHKPDVESEHFSKGVVESLVEVLDPAKFTVPCLDHESARRTTRSVHQRKILDILGIIPDEEVVGLKITEKFELNSRGVEIFSKSWIPETGQPKAAICFCHGYGDTCTFFFEGIARKLAAKNFAVFAIDYAGFGLSGGLHGYIPSFDHLVADVAEHYCSIKKQDEFKDVPLFLMGESMGGAVALKAHLSMPDAWDGAILVAPMCKIAAEMYPPMFLVEILKVLARIIPKAKLVSSGDIAEIGFRDLVKRKQAKQNLISYVGRPRLGTALSLLNATDEIEQDLNKVSVPLLILHGAADRVTDPAISQALYEQACSQDKTLHLYEDSWHAVLEGEPDETVDRAIDDIVRWLDSHTSK